MQIKTERSPSSKVSAAFAILFIRSVSQSAYPPLLLRPAQEGDLCYVRRLPSIFLFSLSKMAGGEVGVTLGQPHLSRQDLATLVRSQFAAGMAQ